jgi:hypothetical protein
MMKLPGTLAFAILVWCGCGLAQPLDGVRVFELTCTTCHGKVQVPPVPDPTALRQMTPESVYQALNTGAEHRMLQLTDDVKRAVAEFVSGRNMMPDDAGEAKRMPNVCPSNPPITSLTTTPAWNGWGVDATNGEHDERSVVWDFIAIYPAGAVWKNGPPNALYRGGPVVQVTEQTRAGLAQALQGRQLETY